MKLLRTLLISAVLCATSNAYAIHEVNKTPARIGVSTPLNLAYFSVVEGLTTACLSGVVWIVLDAAGLGKMSYVSLLTAKVTGKQISYFDYTQDGFGNCYLNGLELAP